MTFVQQLEKSKVTTNLIQVNIDQMSTIDMIDSEIENSDPEESMRRKSKWKKL